MTEYRSTGKTTLTSDVLLTIVRMAALEVEGVKGMAPVRGGVNSLFKPGTGERCQHPRGEPHGTADGGTRHL